MLPNRDSHSRNSSAVARFIVTMATVLGALAVGCSSGNSPTSAPEELSAELAARVKASVSSTQWRLAAFAGQDSSAVLPATRITLILGEEETLSGSAGCNAYFGTWALLDSAQIAISGLGNTEMACAGTGVMAQETRYLQSLAGATKMRLQEGELILAATDEENWLRFARADSIRDSDDGTGQGGSGVDDPGDPGTGDGGGPTHGDSTVTNGIDSTASLAALIRPVWKLRFLETVEAQGTFAQAVPQDVNISAQFDDQGNVSGRAACNQYFAAHGTAANGGLETGPAGVTKRLCQDDLMQWEDSFLDQLSRVQSYHIEGERLILAHEAGALHFETGQHEEPETVEAWPEPDLRLQQPDHGDHLEMARPGQRLEIALPAQPPTGFGWYLSERDSTTLRLAAERFDAGGEPVLGAEGTQRFLFEAVAPGQVKLRLHYARSWERESAADTFEVTITVNGGIVPPNVAPLDIRLGSSFGECMGYCWQEMIVDAESITLVARGWDLEAYPEKIHQQVVDPDLWTQLQDLADFNGFARMDEAYGCPDCADGGAEWVTMSLSGRQQTVRMEYGVQLKPITELLRILRELRGQVVEQAD